MNYSIPKRPTTSFVIRTKNEEKWLGTVLEKLFNQSRKDFEVIIVDNESTDQTMEIVKSFPVHKLITIKNKDFNHAYSTNLGIFNSRGKYVGLTNGHSIPASLSWYAEAIENFSDPMVAAVTGHTLPLPDASTLERIDAALNIWRLLQKRKNVHWISTTNALIRKDLWELYPFDETLPQCEDYDWASEMHARGWKIICDLKFNVYHSHGGLGKKINLERMWEWRRIIHQLDQKPRPSKSFSRLFEVSR